MAVKEITPQQAHDVLIADTTVVYIDVRSEREFSNGHPAGAVNIPVAFADPARGMMANPDFVKVVEANFPRDKKLSLVAKPGRVPQPQHGCLSKWAIKTFLICSAASAACATRWEL